MAMGTSAGCRGHGVFSFGFPAQAPRSGHFGYREVGGLLPEADGVGRLLQLAKANDLTTGFSGGPVVDEMTGPEPSGRSTPTCKPGPPQNPSSGRSGSLPVPSPTRTSGATESGNGESRSEWMIAPGGVNPC